MAIVRGVAVMFDAGTEQCGAVEVAMEDRETCWSTATSEAATSRHTWSGSARSACARTTSCACGPRWAGATDVADETAWIDATAAELGQALADPAIRAEVLALLTGTDDERERQRRMESARRELAGLEVRYPLLRGADDAES